MTDITERLAAIEARVEAADDGPWRVRGPQVDPSWKWAAGVESASLDPGEVDTTIAEVVDAPDAEFIAHARTDVPWLVERVRELQAECLRVDEANTRLGERVRELQAENESLRTALRRKENHRARAREQVRQRDEVIERVRKLADEWERTYPSLMVGPFLHAVLEGDGEVKEEKR